MDPLSITASLIAVLQATTTILSVCYDFRAALKDLPWSLSRVMEEARDLRNTLETLEQIADRSDDPNSFAVTRRPVFQLLCEPQNGPLATCLRELLYLEDKINSSSFAGKSKSKRLAFMQTMSWRLSDRDAKLCLERIERCKSTLNLAITADEATLLLDIKDMTTSLNDAVLNLDDNVARVLGNLRSRELDEKRKEITQWLSPLNSWENHEAAINLYHRDTKCWLFESKVFSDWRGTTSSFLLLSGLPGAGKTILFSKAVEYLTQNISGSNPVTLLAYCYCDFRKSESQDPTNVIGSLVAQLCSQLERYPEEIENAFENKRAYTGQQRKPSLSVLRQALESLAADNEVILLIDAIDECTKRRELLDFFCRLHNDVIPIKVLITSRNEPEIEEAFQSFSQLSMEIYSDEMNHDIAHYIHNRMNSDRKFQWLNSSMKSQVESSLNAKSAGMFRWAQCQLDEIATIRTVKAVRVALKELPQGLHETYSNILSKISQNNVEIARRLLLWLSFSVTPLTLEDLKEAAAIEQGQDHLDEESRLGDAQDIPNLLCSLVSVSDQGYVRLAHLSVKDYLLSSEIRKSPTVSNFAMTPGSANHELAVNCLTYLSFKDLREGPSPSGADYADRLFKHPLLRHAAIQWPYYYRSSTHSAELKLLASELFSPQCRGTFMSWVQILNARDALKWNVYPQNVTSLYYAASFGLHEIVQDLIAAGVDLNAPGSRFGGTAFHAAVLREHLEVMKLLLQAGADPNQADFDGTTPLHTALLYDNPDVIKMLLESGVSQHPYDGIGAELYSFGREAVPYVRQDLLSSGSSKPRGETEEEFNGRRSGMDSSFIVSVESPSTATVNSAI